MTRYIDPRHKVLWHIDRLAGVKAGLRPPPINVEIDLSNRCSLGCEWCHFAYTHTRGPLTGKREGPSLRLPGGDLMDYGLALNILEQLSGAGVKSVTWTGGGEPTLHPQYESIIGHASSVGLAQGMYTHGGHIPGERAQLIKRLLNWVYVSLDECDPAAYKRSKGVDRFGAACDGARRLSIAVGQATVGIGFLLHPDNYRDVHDMVALALDGLGADYVQFRPTVRYEQSAPSAPAEPTAWIDDALPYLRYYADDERVLADAERFEMYRDWNGRGYDTCYWTTMQSVITPNGMVWSCVNKREHAGECLGDMSTESFSDVWKRSAPYAVNGSCRVMCRGHMANITLDAVMTPPAHEEFI